MKNSKKLNRNIWSDQELATLHECVNKAKRKNVGFANAAKKLGRTQAACVFKYYKSETNVINTAATTKAYITHTLTFKIKSWSIENGTLKMEVYKEA